jgi:hypothetical protein
LGTDYFFRDKLEVLAYCADGEIMGGLEKVIDTEGRVFKP